MVTIPQDLIDLYRNAPLMELGAMADAVRREKHPEQVVTYIVDRNINYTNVCVADCGFCAFYRRPKHAEGWTLSYEQIGAKIDEVKALGGVQILIQGGHNPYIPFEWYLDLLRYIKQYHPIHVHGFSPSEVDFWAELYRMDARDVVRELMKAGLDSIPGGGGEILVQRVRDLVARKKAGADRWLEIMEMAHEEGLRTSCTTTAFARVVLDNIPNLQSSWVTMGMKVGQAALHFGCNDFGSLMLEENVVSAANTTYRTSIEEMERLIREAGFTPARRRQDYSIIADTVGGTVPGRSPRATSPAAAAADA